MRKNKNDSKINSFCANLVIAKIGFYSESKNRENKHTSGG